MATARQGSSDVSTVRTTSIGEHRSLGLPGVLLGLGVGGFVDGILLHQVLQWHHMRTGDGILGERSAQTVAGVFVLSSRTRWSDGAWSRWELVGWMLAGWGAFNLIEGLVDHQLLGVHHVRDDVGAPLGWDLAFLASGTILIAAGWGVARRARARART